MNPSAIVLQGIRQPAGRQSQSGAGEVTYTVTETAAPPAKKSEQRAGQRRRTRLRSGKLADASHRFVVECIIHDRSPEGARLRLVADVPLPASLMVYDDETGTLLRGHVVWRNRQDVGIRFEAGSSMAGGSAASTLGAKFYAVPRAPSAR